MAISLKYDSATGTIQQLGAGDALEAASLEPRSTASNLIIGATLTATALVVLGNATHGTHVLGTLKGDSYVELTEGAAPGTPAASDGRLYMKTGDDGLFFKPDTGTEVDLTAGGATPTLQATYAGGNTIAVTAANGTVSIANAADATDVLTLSKTFAGAGHALAIAVGAAALANSDGININFDAATGSGNAALRIDMDAAAEGEGIDVTHNGAVGSVIIAANAVATMFELDADGAVTIAGNSDGVVQVTAEGTGTLGVGTLGSGDVTLVAAGTGNVNVVAVAGDIALQINSVTKLLVDSAGAVAVTPTSGQDFTATTLGSGDIILTSANDIELIGAGDVLVEAGAAQDLVLRANSGQVFLNETGDVDLDQTAATGIFADVSSLLGAINETARQLLGLRDSSASSDTTTTTTPITKASVVIPDEDGTWEVRIWASVSHTNTAGRQSVWIENVTDTADLGRRWINEMKDSGMIVAPTLKREFTNTAGAGAKTIALRYAMFAGAGTMTISDAFIRVRKVAA